MSTPQTQNLAFVKMKPNSLLQALPVFLLFVSTWAADYQAWSAGTLQVTAPGPISLLDRGLTMQINSDGNLVILTNGVVAWNSGYTTPNCNGACRMVFQSDGNLVTYYGNQPLFNTATAGRGALIVVRNTIPFLMIFDAAGNLIWQALSNWWPPQIPFPGDCPDKQSQPWYCIE